MRLVLPGLLPFLLLIPACAQGPVAETRHHDTEAWKAIEPHLPSPTTSSAQVLENEADILRARRFPEDAIDYYNYALARGGSKERLLNKVGLAELQMRNNSLAQAYFTRAVKVNKKDPHAWNNLGAAEYVNGDLGAAISAYKKAIKLNRKEAVYYANLSNIYFERKDFSEGRKQMEIAMKLDPSVFDRNDGQGGIAAHVLSADDRARFAFEMARMYAQQGNEDSMLHSLGMACEAGMNIQQEMKKDPALAKYIEDPRIVMIVQNADAIRLSQLNGKTAAVPALAAEATPAEAPAH